MGIVLAWGLPVLIGAAIGYVTNVVAIRMLFRPLTEKRVFGLRVPLTPGIIPRNRHKLAIGIANTVSRELLNEAVLTERLGAEDLRESVKRSARGILDALLDAPLGTLSGPSSSSRAERAEALVSSLLRAFASSPAFSPALEGAALTLLEAAGGLSLASLLGMEREGAAEDAATRILDALTAEGPSALVRQKAVAMIDSWLGGDRPLEDILPFDPSELASRALNALYPHLLSFLEGILRDPANRGALAARGRDVVGDLLTRLNLFQRFLVQAGQYDKKILENMDRTVEELMESALAWASREDSRSVVCVRAAEALRRWTRMAPAEVAERAPGLREALVGLLDRSLSASRDRRFREAASQALAAGIRGLGRMSVLEAASGVFGTDARGLARLIAASSTGFASGDGPRRFAEAAVSTLGAFLEANAGTSLASLLAMDEARRDEASAWLSEKALAMLAARAGEIVQALKVRETVVAKIDSLDVLSLERIVLDIMKEQFVWIDILGAVLGALIGLFQAFLSRIL